MHGSKSIHRPGASLKMKISIALVSLVTALAFLEVGLRFIGPAGQRSERIYRKENLAPGPKILCVGDSFTHGGRTRRDETYPYYLEQMIHEASRARPAPPGTPSPGPYRVVNAGVCAMNTREMWEFLPEWIETFRPEILLLLAGSANWFSPLDYDLYRRGDWFSRLKRLLFRSRVVKMLFFLKIQAWGPERLIRADDLPERYRLDRKRGGPPAETAASAYGDRLRTRYASLHDVSAGGSPLTDAWKARAAGVAQEALALSEESGPGQGNDAILLRAEALSQAGRYQDADTELTRALADRPDSAELRQALAFYRRLAADRCRQQRRMYESLEWYLEAIEADPSDADNYSWTFLISGFQSRYSAADVLAALENLPVAPSSPAAAEAFRESKRLLAERAAEQADFEKHTDQDLQPVADLCKANGVLLIVLNYPISYPMINGVLEKLARENDLPFVDNLAVFRDLHPRERFILDDEHCSPEGHRVLAENVYRALQAQGALHPEATPAAGKR